MDERDAVEALERLGLSNYEARVFVALQVLGSGTAREVHRVSDIPRSQVYGAADQLEQRGLVEIQHSNPIQYRAVSLAEAKRLLERRFEQDRERAFDFLEKARQTDRPDQEERDEVWTIDGREHINDRIEEIIRSAESGIVLGAKLVELVPSRIIDALVDQAANGVSVIVVSENEEVLERCRNRGEIITNPLPESLRTERAGRMLLVDDDVVLLSVIGADEDGHPMADIETAIWSSSTGFAAVLSTILTSWLETNVLRD